MTKRGFYKDQKLNFCCCSLKAGKIENSVTEGEAETEIDFLEKITVKRTHFEDVQDKGETSIIASLVRELPLSGSFEPKNNHGETLFQFFVKQVLLVGGLRQGPLHIS